MMEPREKLIASLGVRNEEGTRLLIVYKTMVSKYISGKESRLDWSSVEASRGHCLRQV